MEVLQLGNCENEPSAIPKSPPHINIRAHTVHPSSAAVILKSGILSKKGLGFTGNKYKSRLFELTSNGELVYYELKSNGQKTKKGEIMITSTTRIEKRSGGTRRDAKFIIHTKNRKWYLWCNHAQQPQKQKHIKKPSITLRPSNAIYKFKSIELNKSKSSIPTSRRSHNSISLTSDRSKTLYPYPYLSNSNKSLNSGSNTSLLSPTTSDTVSTSLSVQTPETMDKHSPLTLSKESLEYTSPRTSSEAVVVQRNGKEESMEWVDILNNMIEGKRRKECILRERQFDDYLIDDDDDDDDYDQSNSKKDSFDDFEIVARPRSNSCPLRSYRTDEYIDNDTNYDPNAIWTLKESYLWSKGDGYYSKQYTRKYFVLRLNGKLDWYLDKTMIDKKGSVDILNSCINIEKRKGSDKRDCKLIIFTRRRNYYFWCKEDKKLSDEWYHMIRLIISDKMKAYNNKIEMSVSYRKNSSAHNSLCDTKFDEYKEDEIYGYDYCDNNDDDDDDEFIPQLFCPDNYDNYSSILMGNNGETDNSKHGEIELIENILNDDVNSMNLRNIKQIHKWIPLSYRCYDWQLLYSSEIDGYSMLTFYEKCSDSGPTILIIKDENDYIFGVFLSDSICLDNKLFFGNGETFVFNIYPNLKKFNWKGLNRFFIHCKNNTLTFGGGDDGHSALVLTDNFRYGISQKSQTFQNDILSKNIDFNPCLIEVWTFKNYW